jgi:hypothetical protein
MTAAAATSPADAALWLHRSEHGWQLASTRREWAARLLRGRHAAEAPRLLPALYSLCGGAHRLAASHAVAAARGEATGPTEADAQHLRLDTLREHLRRLWLDGPRLLSNLGDAALPDAGAMAAALARCPLLGSPPPPHEAAFAPGRRWVQDEVFGTDIDEWIAAWRINPATVATRWSTYPPAAAAWVPWPVRWLAALRGLLGAQAMDPMPPPPHALRLAGDPAALRRLAECLREQASFALAPTLNGQPAETGCWTRAADPHAQPGSTAYAPLWMRHAARLAEVAHLSGALGARWLAQGALCTGPREGLGWCEMARGLLVHWVRLGADDRVAEYRVLAPTEWNFHPQGAAAQRLCAAVQAAEAAGAAGAAQALEVAIATPLRESAQLPPPALLDMAQIRAAAAAYDPCVELHIEPMPSRPPSPGSGAAARGSEARHA